MRTHRSIISFVVFAVFSTLTFVSALHAQNARGTLVGHVQDPSGAAVLGARVTYRNVATGVSGSFTTNPSGDYVFVDLVPGTYDITCVAKGFKTATSTLNEKSNALLATHRPPVFREYDS